MDDTDFEDDEIEVKPEPAHARTPEQKADEAIAIALEFYAANLSIAEMIYHIDLEAHLIEGEQRARLLAGFISQPVEEQIARAARHHAVLTFLKRLHEQPGEAAAYFANIQKKRNQR